MKNPDARADIGVVLCDLDGVIWLAHEPIPGSVAAVAALRDRGISVLFVTNNSSARIEQHEAALAQIGIPAAGDVLSSAQGGAQLVSAGERVMVGGGAGIVEAVQARGATAELASAAPSGRFDAVVVGLYRDFTFDHLVAMNAAIRGGARLIATNDDATFPTPRGPEPGGGSIVAAVATASETTPTIGGKPHSPMADVVRERVGDDFDAARVLMVGDRWSTDGAFAMTIGCRFGLVRSGVTRPGVAVPGSPAFDAPDLASLVRQLDS